MAREQPSNIENHLQGIDYPATKQDLLTVAEANNAPENVIETLQGMPSQQYEGPDDVMKAFGKQP